MRLDMFYVEFILIIHMVLGAIRLHLQAYLQVHTKKPQDTKEARVMALLSSREVLGMYL